MSGNSVIVDWAVGGEDAPTRHHFECPRAVGQSNAQWLPIVQAAIFDNFWAHTPILAVPSQPGQTFGKITLSYEGAVPSPFFTNYLGNPPDPTGGQWLDNTNNVLALKFGAYPPV